MFNGIPTSPKKIKTSNYFEVPNLLWSRDTPVSTAVDTSKFIRLGVSTLDDTPTDVNFIYSLDSRWPPKTNFALEIVGYSSTGSRVDYFLYDWDDIALTKGYITLLASTPTTKRSPIFNLIPGHDYSFGFSCYTTGYTGYLSSVKLITFSN